MVLINVFILHWEILKFYINKEGIMIEQDTCIMYLIVNTDLKMSIGKTCAQIGHAVQKLMEHYYSSCYRNGCDPYLLNQEELSEAMKITSFAEWLNIDYRKVVLSANQKEFEKIKSALKPEKYIIVKDNGLTELSPNTETVIGLFPINKSDIPKIIKRLQTLK